MIQSARHEPGWRPICSKKQTTCFHSHVSCGFRAGWLSDADHHPVGAFFGVVAGWCFLQPADIHHNFDDCQYSNFAVYHDFRGEKNYCLYDIQNY